ncbi:hypothetical protein BHE74_00017794, partial [Ensete ventricosum]
VPNSINNDELLSLRGPPPDVGDVAGVTTHVRAARGPDSVLPRHLHVVRIPTCPRPRPAPCRCRLPSTLLSPPPPSFPTAPPWRRALPMLI